LCLKNRPVRSTETPVSAGPSALTGRAIKVTIVLDTAQLAMLHARDGQRRTTLRKDAEDGRTRSG